MHPEKNVLKNNLRVLFTETNSFPSFTAELLVAAGSRYETVQNNGIAHFFEHMAFKGTKKYPNSLAIASTIEGLGGAFNAFTDKDHTGYWIKAPVQHFETVLDVIAEMLLASKLEPEEIDREKGVILEEMNMYEDNPARKVGDIYETLLYEGTPLGMEIIGTKETVPSFTRETFTSYMDAFYRPSNAVLTIAGGFKGSAFEKTYKQVIEDKFKGWTDTKTAAPQVVADKQTEPQFKVKFKKTEQAHFCLGFRTYKMFDPRRYALSVLTNMLGGGMSSKLFIEVRERRGLCYYISTGREFYTDVGNVVTQAGVTNNAEKVKEAMEVTLAEHKKMKAGDFSDADITRAKELMKGRFIMSLEDSGSIAGYYGLRELFNDELISPEEMMARIDKVTREEIMAIAKDCFVPEKLNIALIGPFKQDDIVVDYGVLK